MVKNSLPRVGLKEVQMAGTAAHLSGNVNVSTFKLAGPRMHGYF